MDAYVKDMIEKSLFLILVQLRPPKNTGDVPSRLGLNMKDVVQTMKSSLRSSGVWSSGSKSDSLVDTSHKKFDGMKIFCKFGDSSFPVDAEPTTTTVGDLKEIIFNKLPEPRPSAALQLLLVRVFETPSKNEDGGVPVGGVEDDTDLVEVERAVLSKRSSGVDVEKVRRTEDGTEVHKLERYKLTRDTEEGYVDILVILPGSTAVYTTREQIIKRETATTDLDGINVQLPLLDRKNILDDICYAFEDQGRRFVLLSSPAGSGKTSVLNLLEAGKTKYKCFYLSCVRYKDLADVLFSELKARSSYVIDLAQSSSSLPADIDIVIMIDDAQVTYSNTGSWTHFIKNGPKFTPGNVKFVISATHMLNGGKESPL
ncbi:hypothetical protein HK098_007073, partial [Nowakowskiella sp. JEL0407]